MQENANSQSGSDVILASINTALPTRKIRDLIDRLDISADSKAILC